MPKYEKFHKHDRKPVVERQSEPQMEEEEEVKWNPTPEVFEAFLVRDAELCATNLRMVLSSRPSLSLKEMKDSTLHSSDVVERQVLAWLQDGLVTETKGKYSLVPTVRGQ